MPVTCDACGMRQFPQPGDLPPTYETHWNRLGISNSPHLSEAQAMSRVCRHNKSAGCLTKGLPMPEPEPGLEPYLNDAERLELAEEIYGQIKGDKTLTTIKAVDIIGKYALSPEKADRLYSEIHSALQDGSTVEIDFSGVEFASAAFFVNSIGEVMNVFEAEVFDRLRFLNLNALLSGILNEVIEGLWNQPGEIRGEYDAA